MSELFPRMDEVLINRKLGIKSITICHVDVPRSYELGERPDLLIWENLLEDALYDLVVHAVNHDLTYAQLDCLGTPVIFTAGLRNQKVEGVLGTFSFVGVDLPWIVLEEGKVRDLSKVKEALLKLKTKKAMDEESDETKIGRAHV